MDVNLIGENSKPKIFDKEIGRLAIYLFIYYLLLVLSICFNIIHIFISS